MNASDRPQRKTGSTTPITECMVMAGEPGKFLLLLACEKNGVQHKGALSLPYTASLAPLTLAHRASGEQVTVTPEQIKDFLSYGYDFDTESEIYAAGRRTGERPRVAFLINDPTYMGGGTIVFCRYINWLADMGVEVTLYTEGPLPSWTTINARIRSIPDFKERYAAVSEPVVIAFSVWYIPYFLCHNDTRGKRIYHLCQGAEEFHFCTETTDLMRPLPVFDLLNTLPVGRIVVSPSLQRYFQDKYGQQPLLINNGIDLELFSPGARRQVGAAWTVMVNGNPGDELKGVATVREALAMVARRRSDRRFTLVNVCGAQPELCPPLDTAFTCEIVHGLTPGEMRDRYRTADVYVNASRYEGFGLPSIEAMACGTPVIQADNHGLDGVVEDGRDCLMVPPGSPAALATALERLLDDGELCERLAKNGRATAGHFSLASQHRMLAEAFSTITGTTLTGEAHAFAGASPAPLFSVMVPCYNQASFLVQALDSLIAQSYPNWEAVVVNDGSSDDTAQVMADYAARDPRVRPFHKENGGVASALNRAVAEARGEWICWLSSDDLFLPDKLALHLEEMGRDPGARLLQTNYLVLYDESGATVPSSIDTARFIPPVAEQVVRFFQINYYNGISVAVHRSVFETVGGFNEAYRYGQDFDFWLRASARFRSRFLDRATCVTRIHPGQGTNLFTEAGIYDSARAALEFLNSHEFADIFPCYDLSQVEQALAAVAAVSAVLASADSFLGRCGYRPALADRLGQWLMEAAPTEAHEEVRALWHGAQGSYRALLQRALGPVAKGYRPHDALGALENELEQVRKRGNLQEERAMVRYLAMVRELNTQQGASMNPDQKAARVPFFSVLIPTYNQAAFLPAALESLLAQTFDDWEAVIVNDGSTDDTAAVMERCAAGEPRFRCFTQDNGGVGAALNTALAQARGRWICWLSSDDLFEPDKLAVHRAAIEAYPETAFFFTHFYYLDDNTGEKSAPELWNPVPQPQFQVARFFLGPYVHGNSVAVRRDVFDRVGSFDASLRNGQDFDMWLRISARFPSLFIDSRTCVTRWHKGQSTNAFPEAGFYDSARALAQFINHHDFRQLFPLLDLSSVGDAVQAVQETLNVSLSPGAVMHRCGPSTALLERLHEWLDCHAPAEIAASLRPQIVAVAASAAQSGADPELVAAIRDFGHPYPQGYRFAPQDFKARAEAFQARVAQAGEAAAASSLAKYIQALPAPAPHAPAANHGTSGTEASLRILFYYAGLHNSARPFAGSSNVTVQLARQLAAKDPACSVTLTGDHVTSREETGGGVLVPLPPPAERAAFLHSFDVVVFATHLGSFGNIVKPAAQRWILHQHCWDLNPAERTRLEDFDLVIGLTQGQKRRFEEQGVPSSRLAVLANAIDTDFFSPRPVPRKPHSVMFSGAVVPHKGVHILLQAFTSVRAQFPDAELHVYGNAAMWREDAGYERELMASAPEGTYFHGAVANNEMPEIYSSHSVLCLPSQLESFGLVTVEAQACGCVPIVNEAGGMPETVQNRITGLVYTPNQPDVLAAHIVAAFQSLDADPAIRQRCVDFARQMFRLEDQGARFQKLVRALAQGEAVAVQDSELDRIIAPEVKNDELYHLITELAQAADIRTVLEIGSSAGGGSTEAFVAGLAANPGDARLFCMEVSRARFKELSRRYADRGFVKCYNTSSVPLRAFATPDDVEGFYHSTRTNLNQYPLAQILGWLQQDIDYVAGAGFDQDGIRLIQQENGIEHFDMVLIDGSEFTGEAELERVYGARWLILDDVNAYKNYVNYHRLKKDPTYELYRENWQLRNGYAVFRKKEDELPVHFFTIVLNGMPFIRYHADVFRTLPFKWHWHIVEGVADLVHDTAWSVQLGGKISDAFHSGGRSIDGTTEYLDKLKRLFPEQVTVYRKPEGKFWHGKLEMVQAPVANLPEHCLLWQVDVDEFWTAAQLSKARERFLANPEKTAALYWCHFFVGPRLVVGSRNCYSQNPAMEWLRTWRYTKGCQWIAHEPPRLHRPLPDGGSVDLACIDPFLHGETEREGIVFQHFAYVLPEQLRFKETYYGYRGALACWQRLQEQKRFPLLLRDYFPWVCDQTTVVPVEEKGIVPIELPVTPAPQLPVTVVDGVFYQMNMTGIARVWTSLLIQWAGTDFGRSLVVLDRAGTAPRVPGIRYRSVPCYEAGDWDRTMLQTVCDDEGADVFVSTYYSTPLTTPSLFLAHDMIPEFTDCYDLSDAQWQEKHHAINRASAFVAVSRSTARDLVKLYPNLEDHVVVAHNGIDHDTFAPAPEEEVQAFRRRHGLDKPYFLFVGMRQAYKNGLLPLHALKKLPDPGAFTLLYVGGVGVLEPEVKALARNLDVRLAKLSDRELICAYSGAAALLYPSTYEGFGLPILEAMACRCPVITCQNSSIPEVAGAAALYVSPTDPGELSAAMMQVTTPEVRQHLVHLGSRQVAKFSWKKMADIIRGVICSTFPARGGGNRTREDATAPAVTRQCTPQPHEGTRCHSMAK
ncbi:glycosyltransferase [Geomonas agri]|uniref:glycosyltransferase n=1 Tax=Geomonas agri TaxID=2873702 RepID=UPI001CD6B858|nr:glycosyltransferase [Geomonas agri]